MSKAPLTFKKCHRCGERIGWDETPNPICSDCAVERITELEAENAKLRKCVVAADELSNNANSVCNSFNDGGLDGWEIELLRKWFKAYDAARAEVDK